MTCRNAIVSRLIPRYTLDSFFPSSLCPLFTGLLFAFLSYSSLLSEIKQPYPSASQGYSVTLDGLPSLAPEDECDCEHENHAPFVSLSHSQPESLSSCRSMWSAPGKGQPAPLSSLPGNT